MKKIVTVVAIVCVMGLTVPAAGQSVKIENTPHNLNNLDVWGVQIPQNQICLPCHVPHHAYPDDDAIINMVLWNHEETDAQFTMYTTLDGDQGTLDGPSKLCLSCHDGVTAIDNYGGNSGFFNDIKIPASSSANLGTDLTDDHPIGIEYPDGEQDYHPASGLVDVKLVNVNGVDRVECTSCHDPHNNGLGNFLRVTIAGSEICLRCHDK